MGFVIKKKSILFRIWKICLFG